MAMRLLPALALTLALAQGACLPCPSCDLAAPRIIAKAAGKYATAPLLLALTYDTGKRLHDTDAM